MTTRGSWRLEVSSLCVVCGVGPIKGKPRSGLCRKAKRY